MHNVLRLPALNIKLGLKLSLIYESTPRPGWPQEWSDQIFDNVKFINWLGSLGIHGDIGEPMMGGVGRAYPVGNKFIIKFTTDQPEVDAARQIMERPSEHAVKIYGIAKIGTFPSVYGTVKELYSIVQERLNPKVGKRMRAAGNAIYDYMDENDRFIEDPEEVIDDVFNHYLPKKHKNEQMKRIVTKMVMALYDVQEKSGVLSQDPHGGNIAFKGRNPAFFDFGRSRIK